MKEINDEIKLTLNLIQTVNDECVYSAMQDHLRGLLEIKRNELQKRLPEGSLAETALEDPAKPLTTAELLEGGWWCADISKECAIALESKGLRVSNSFDWGNIEGCGGCGVNDDGVVIRGCVYLGREKQIHRSGDDFYWSE